jgi:hypothetical protein
MTTGASIRELTADEIAAVAGGIIIQRGSPPGISIAVEAVPSPVPVLVLPPNPVLPSNPVFELNPAAPILSQLFSVGGGGG